MSLDLPAATNRHVAMEAERKSQDHDWKSQENLHRFRGRPEIEDEFNKLTEKGKTQRADKRKERLDLIDAQLEDLYEEWLILGERKKSWKN